MKCSILLVDDEQDFVETLRERLEVRKMDVQAVYSGEEALDWLTKNQTDVVVLDVKMPGMNGIEALRLIKEKWPMLEIVMLTGNQDVEAAIQGMKLGAYDYLMKPMDIDELTKKLRLARKRKKQQEARILKGTIDGITQTRSW